MRKLRILIVEDDEPTASSTAVYLEAAGFEWARLATGKGAVDYAHPKMRFDAIVLDTTLPDIPGLDAIVMIRAEGYRIPILVLSAEASIEVKVDALNRGADDYMTKPFHKDELVARLHAIDRSRQLGYDAACGILEIARTKVA